MKNVGEPALRQEPIELFEIASWPEIYRGLRDDKASLIDLSVEADEGRIYCLFGRSLANGRAKRTRYYYAVAVLEVDWEAGRYVGKQVYELGDDYRTEYHWIRALGEDFLLVSRWCDYNDGDPKRNGLLVGRDGTIRRDYCFGSGIENCLVLADGTIVTGYDDAESFADACWGNEDPHDPLASLNGVVAFRPDGTQFWNAIDHKYAFLHICSALSRDAHGHMWAYYDTCEYDPELDRGEDDFDWLDEEDRPYITDSCRLAKTDLRGACEFFIRCSAFVERSSDFSVAPSQRKLLFRGGVGYSERFFLVVRQGEQWVAEAEVVPHRNGEPFSWREDWGCQFMDYRTLWTNDSGLYGYRFV